MSWLVLLIIFWKPIFYLSMYAYTNFYLKKQSNYLNLLSYWFYDLWMLVWPREGEDYNATKKERQ